MVNLVEQMLALHHQAVGGKGDSHLQDDCHLASPGQIPQEKERLKRQIEATDRAIDALVYALYGLSEEEIKIVEGDFSKA
jgi:hypothetical protein